MAVIGFVPARGGSKSIPMKNIKLINGKPLIYWSALALQEACSIKEFYIATDDLRIKEVALSFGFDKLKVYDRLPENAQDHSSTESVIIEFLNKKKFDENDSIILVQLTNPFLKSEWINEALIEYSNKNYDSLLSVVPSKRFFWNFKGKSINYDFINRPRRQDFDGQYMENGSFYINKIRSILFSNNRLSGNIGFYEMPEYTGFEIDEPDDWIIVEALLRKHYVSKSQNFMKFKLIATDVDGVLTDAGMYYSQQGDELKRFSTYDGKAFELFRNEGLKTAILTAENTQIVANRAKKMKIDFLYQGVSDKLSIMKDLCKQHGIKLDEVIYVGDDINDKELLQSVGLAFSPANAQLEIVSLTKVINLNVKGGDGVIRAVYNYLKN
jgi:YrbI family 3-deoxy-D-manno-octulosonate 8-phosphate phosphatase